MSPRAGRRRPEHRWPLGVALVVLALVALATLVVPAADATIAPGALDGTPTVTSGIDYSGAGDGSLLLDVYEPTDTAATHPAVVLVHGGGWTTGDRTLVAPDAVALAEQGFVAFSIDYTDTGGGLWPRQLDDVRTAVRWVQANAATYRVDPTRVGLFGSSAGANLALLVATEGLADPAAPPVKAVVSWSGPTDLTTLAPTDVSATQLTGGPGTVADSETPVGCAGNPVCLGVLDPQAIQAYLGCTIDDCPQTYLDASPAYQVSASTPPVMVASASTDLVPVEQAYAMVNALSVAGVANVLLVVPGEGHAESYRATALAPSIAFLTTYLVDQGDPRTATTTPPSTIAGSSPLPAVTDGYRLPTPPPPAAVQAVLTPGPSRLTIALIGGAVLLVVAVAVAVVAARRRRT